MEIKQINNELVSARLRFKSYSEGKTVYRLLSADTELFNYFGRYYPFVEIKGMRKYLSRSKYFDKKFMDNISADVKNSKELFLSGLINAANQYGTDFKIKVSNKDLLVLNKLLYLKLFPYFTPSDFPGKDEVIEGLNLRASAGLPTPWFSKKIFIGSINNILDSVLVGEFNLFEFLEDKSFFSSAFKRFQISSTKMKARLVYCLHYSVNVVEKYYDVKLKAMFKHPECPMIHGKTQCEISLLLSRYAHLHCISLDVVGFDIKTPAEIIYIAFEFMHDALGLVRDSYLSKLFFDIRDFSLCLPCFHPALQLIERKRGINSGSGLTSSLGSFCMYIMHTLCLLNYCKKYKKNIFRVTYIIYVSSDDSVIFTGFKINTEEYMTLFNRMFDLELELEGTSEKGLDVATFLGSTWKIGVPYRNTNRMFGRILFGSPNIPRMDNEHLLFCSRCYEILGNVGNFEALWKTFHTPMSVRLFRFSELMDYGTRTKFLKLNTIDRRGFWDSRDPSVGLDRVWQSR